MIGVTVTALCEMHPMRALFLIPRNPPPKLKTRKWSVLHFIPASVSVIVFICSYVTVCVYRLFSWYISRDHLLSLIRESAMEAMCFLAVHPAVACPLSDTISLSKVKVPILMIEPRDRS